MSDATRIRIAATVTTLFIGALAGTGIAMRSRDNAVAPAVASPPVAAAAASVAAGSGPSHQLDLDRETVDD